MNDPMPALFVGHGNPINALGGNRYAEAWAALGRSLPRPQAILSISAHYYIPFCMVTANAETPTIHDFDGFPKEMYEIRYPAPGSPELAGRVRDLLAPETVRFDEGWGLDHGTWSVLVHLFPEADVPVVQLSMDENRLPAHHFDLGRRLAPLRDEGVMILGSGNLVHNLARYRWRDREGTAFDWAQRFERRVRDLLAAGETGPLVDYQGLGDDARRAVPTPEHYLPFLYMLSLRREGEPIAFPVEGFDGGSVSMLAVRIG